MKPLKTEFSTFVQFTDNIEDRLIDFHIDNAFEYDIKPKIGDDLADDILDHTVGSPPLPELEAFFADFVKRWWILCAYKRFLQNHGRNVTQFGYTQLQDPAGTFQQVDSEGRAVELRQIEHDKNVSETQVFKQDWVFDGETYSKPGDEDLCGHRERGKNFGISAIR